MKSIEEIEAVIATLSREEQVDLLERLTKRYQPTCYELAKEILEEAWRGGGTGQTDLSTNKKHLEDYGKPGRRVQV
jgi:hypothetical protein